MKTYETSTGLKYAEEDNYEQGCLSDGAFSSICDVTFEAGSKVKLIEKIKEFFDVSDDSIELDACGEQGRIDISVMEMADGTQAGEIQIELWKTGSLRLWACTYTYQVCEVERTSISVK